MTQSAVRIIFPEKGQVALQAYDLFEPGSGSGCGLGPGPNEVLIQTIYSLMSIGTETIILHQKYSADTHFARIFSFPQLKTGVQAVGTVKQVGSDVIEFEPGDLVYMRMAHGSHQLMSAKDCSPIPADIDLKSACWAGLAKTAFRTAVAAPFTKGQHVLIIGAGPVGQMAVRWASAYEVGSIAVSDFSRARLEHAQRGGATHLFEGDVSAHLHEIARLNDGEGPSVVVDVTGSPAVFGPALTAAARFGKVMLLGDTGYPEQQHLSSEVMTKGLSIQATHDSHDRDGWTQRRIDERFFRLVAEGRFSLSDLITHEFSPDQCEQAYALASDHGEQAMGILYDWREFKTA